MEKILAFTTPIMRNKKHRRIIEIILIVLLFVILGILIYEGRHHLNRRTVRSFEQLVNSFGIFAPLGVIGLIVLSTVVPFLPVPVPIVEITAGLIFGFQYGFLIAWVAQCLSSYLAFVIAKIVSKKALQRWLAKAQGKTVGDYVERKGIRAVLILRLTMLAPFNVVSYVAGMANLSTDRFILATTVGVIPEVLIYTAIGSQLTAIHIRFWYVFLLLLVIQALSFCFSWVGFSIWKAKIVQ